MNQIYSHPDQPQMQAEVILASEDTNQEAPPLITIRLRYPRIIHSELMTHRVFSRNARSSRAVPVARMIQEIREKPFIPWHWGKNQKGMQADVEHDELICLPDMSPQPGEYTTNVDAWYEASLVAADYAEAFHETGYHKQIVNRLLEPFMWIDTLVTSTEWSNFLWLRDHKDAEPHLQDLARLVKQAIDECDYEELDPGEWHLPYITIHDLDTINSACGIRGEDPDKKLLKISAARCARISYAPFDGDASYERELERYESLVSSDRIHASPMEHQATPDMTSDHYSAEGELVGADWDNPHLHGNFTGWIQYRKTIPNENHR